MKAVLISAGDDRVGGVFYAFYYNNLFPAQVFDIAPVDRDHPRRRSSAGSARCSARSSARSS